MMAVTLPVLIDPAALLDAVVQSGGDGELEDWYVLAGFAGLMVMVGGASVKKGFDLHRTSWIVDDTPTEKVRSIAAGRTELKGLARPFGETYDQPFTDGDCVYAEWRVTEKVKKRNEEGEWETEWEYVDSGTQGEHVLLEDETGSIVLESPPVDFTRDEKTVKKWKANENPLKRIWRWITSNPRPDPPYADFLREQGLAVQPSKTRRYRQYVLEEGTDLYALGQATPIDSASDLGSATDHLADETDVLEELAQGEQAVRDDLVIEEDSASEEYLVSTKGESSIVWHHRLKTIAWLATGSVLVVGGLTWVVLTAMEQGFL